MLHFRLETMEASINVQNLKKKGSNSKEPIWETERNEWLAWKKEMKRNQRWTLFKDKFAHLSFCPCYSVLVYR